MARFRLTLLLPILALAFASLACSIEVGGSSQPTPQPALRVLAAAELADLKPLLPSLQKAAGTRLEFTFQPSIQASSTLVKDAGGYDLAWLATTRYLQALQSGAGKVYPQEKTMRSPVVVGIKTSRAHVLGWVDAAGKAAEVTWTQIAQQAAQGAFRYAMSDPNQDNAGFSALASVATALSGEGGALTKADLLKNNDALRGWIGGQALKTSDPAVLADRFLQASDLDGIITYEASILAINDSGKLKDPLVVIYPQDGVMSADYPLLLVNPARRAEFAALVTYLHSEGFQQQIAQTTHRRPVEAGALMHIQLPARLLLEQPFPPTRGVIEALLARYAEAPQNLPRPTPAPTVQATLPAQATVPPAANPGDLQGDQVIFVIDVSRRMQDGALDRIKSAFQALLNDAANINTPQRWRIVAYNQGIDHEQDFVVNPGDADSLKAAAAYIDGLQASGNKGEFDALMHAYQGAKEQAAKAAVKLVLISGGKSVTGGGWADFKAFYESEAAFKAAHTDTIAVDGGDPNELQQIAALTGGVFYDARSGNLAEVLKQALAARPAKP